MIIIACGDRNWTDYDLIQDTLKELRRQAYLAGETIEVIQGGNGYLPDGRSCKREEDLRKAIRGADALAAKACWNLGIQYRTFFADWNGNRKGAGPIRNAVMLRALLEHRDRNKQIVAFHDDLGKSRGTANMLKLATKPRVPSIHIHHEG